MKRIFIPIVIVALFNYGCYSFYEISSEDISSVENHDIKLELKNKLEILLKKEGNFNIKATDSMIYFSNETTKDSIKISDIERIYNKKQSFWKTFGLGLNIVAVMLFVLSIAVSAAMGPVG